MRWRASPYALPCCPLCFAIELKRARRTCTCPAARERGRLNQAEHERTTPGCDDDPAQVHRAWNGDDEDEEVDVRRRRPWGELADGADERHRPWNEAGEAADELEEEGPAAERAQTEGMRADEGRWLRKRARQR